MILRLPFIGSYDWPLALRIIGAHAVPGVERLEADSQAYTRVLARRRGPLAVTVRPDADHIVVDTDGGPVRVTDDDASSVAGRIARWLDLELDPAVPVAAFGDDVKLGPLVAQRPGLRRIGYPDTFEAVVSTVLGQQVSLAAARTLAGRAVAAYGRSAPRGLSAFPSPERLATVPAADLQRTLGITGSRARTVHAVAELFVHTGDWPVPLPAAGWDARAAQLLALPGIGPWTVAYLRMRVFGDPDAVPVGDLVLRRALGAARDLEVLATMEQWRPERTYATFQLWASTAW